MLKFKRSKMIELDRPRLPNLKVSPVWLFSHPIGYQYRHDYYDVIFSYSYLVHLFAVVAYFSFPFAGCGMIKVVVVVVLCHGSSSGYFTFTK